MQLAPAARPNPELMTVYARASGKGPGDLPVLAAKILELIDGTRRTDEVLEAAQIPVAKGLAVVRKLSRLGIIETVPGARARRATAAPVSACPALERVETLRGLPPVTPARGPGFSAAEEAFFASEVEPTLDPEAEPSGLRHRLSLLISDLVLYLRRDVAL